MLRLLDLFCGQGGAAMGYAQAGFEVVGVDINPQPRYPFKFWQGDALELCASLNDSFDVIHASPPCQQFTAYRRRNPETVGHMAPNLIPATRDLLRLLGKPWIIENVPGAPLIDPLTLCGSMFGLDVRRHRIFQTNFWIPDAPKCNHKAQQGSFPQATNRKNRRKTCEIGAWRIPLEVQQAAMGGCEWMDLRGLSQAIPPAYTRWIGSQIIGRWNDGEI